MNNKLRSVEVFAIILGAIIGMGSFMLPGTKFLPSAGVVNTSIGLFLGTMCIVIIEKSYRYMMMQNISEGGEFSFTLMFFGKKHAFVVGWFLFLAYLTLIPLNALAFPIVINYLFPNLLTFGYMYTIAGDSVYLAEVLTSSLLILIFAYINLIGIKNTGKVQKYIIYCLVFSIFIVFAAMLIKSDFNKFSENYLINYKFNIKEILQIIAVAPFLFIGFDAIPQLVKDLDVSKKKASTISVIGLLFGMLIYIILNLMAGLSYSAHEAMQLEWALGSGIMENVGKWGFVFIVIGLASAVSAGINGFMVCSTKLIGAMSREKIMPKSFATLNKYGVAKNTIYFVSIVGILLSLFGREVVIWIVDMCSFGASITYLYVCLITARNAKDRHTVILAYIGVIISTIIALMLLVPMSPAKLSIQPLILLLIWIISGAAIGYKLLKN